LKPAVSLIAMGLPDTRDYEELEDAVEEKPKSQQLIFFLKTQGPTLVYIAFALNGMLVDAKGVVSSFQNDQDGILGSIGNACVVLACSSNIGGYLAVMMVYALHSTKSDGFDAKQNIFGETKGPQSLTLFTMFFMIPESLSSEALERMTPAARILLYILHYTYRPVLRVIIVLVTIPASLVYCWIAVPLVLIFLMMFLCVNGLIMKPLLNRMMRNKSKGQIFEGKDTLDHQINALSNTMRFNLVLPVVFAPLFGIFTRIGVKLALTGSILSWGSLSDSLFKPSFFDYLSQTLAKANDGLNALYLLL